MKLQGKKKEIQATDEERDNAHRSLSQASPSLVRILPAMFLTDGSLAGVYYTYQKNFLFKIHMMLDVSWDELRTVVCSLRPLIGDRAEKRFIRIMSIVALDPTLSPPRFDSILRDLACGSLHAMRQVLFGEIDKNVLLTLRGWGYYLRSCLPSPKLLQELDVIEPFFMTIDSRLENSDLYNTVQWLKTFPQPPLELIRCFESYYSGQATDRDFEHWERRWSEWKKGHKPYLDMAELEHNDSTGP